ncbi:MAG: YIP1 family protein [Paenibacillaceae bacterium]|nr:YIP1 family protein [Paenibacillaceae bacterium]
MRAEHLAFPFRLLLRPFAGYDDLKHEQAGRLSVALGLVLLLVLVAILKRQYAGFLFNFTDPRQLNSWDELKLIALPFLVWCVANWSLTTLMDGEGTFREIVTATGYAVTPLIVVYAPQIALSHLLTLQEGAFYYLLQSLAGAWFVWLLFIGTMTVHQYSVTKTIVTMALTLVVIGIIIFLGVLFFSLIQQMIVFVQSLYQELSFRM